MTPQERDARLNDMMDAWSTYQEARRCAVEAIAAALPVGTEIAVTIGRARIRGAVTGVSEWDTGTVWMRNQKTGKPRKFNACWPAHDLAIIDPSRKQQ